MRGKEGWGWLIRPSVPTYPSRVQRTTHRSIYRPFPQGGPCHLLEHSPQAITHKSECRVSLVSRLAPKSHTHFRAFGRSRFSKSGCTNKPQVNEALFTIG